MSLSTPLSQSALDQLRTMTTVVADSGDFESIVSFKPIDSTTNPSLLLSAAQLPKYASLVDDAISYAKAKGGANNVSQIAMDKLLVNFGCEILKIIPGRVSSEVDARLSLDTNATIEKALHIISMYAEQGVDKERVLIKIASTWEGIQAAKVLEAQHGIHCNLTLLFGLAQAAACADARVTLISPFVGRILDWYKKATGNEYTAENDPGVQSVRRIYNYLKKNNFSTIVMGASFRNVGEIEELAGIDYLTISPKLLEELASSQKTLSRKLNVEEAKKTDSPLIHCDEATFRAEMSKDQMASELLTDGIKRFDEDAAKLEAWIKTKLV